MARPPPLPGDYAEFVADYAAFLETVPLSADTCRNAVSRVRMFLGLGVGISLDELAIGFSLGLTRLPVGWVIAAIALEAFVSAQLGLAFVAGLSQRFRECAEQLAALALIGLGIVLIAANLAR